MDINLSKLNINHEIDITGIYNIPKSYFEKSEVLELNNINVKGKIYIEDEEECIKCIIEGEMIIPDTISLEKINYPFKIEYDDIISKTSKKSENTLDIFEFLWENIVLEVPLQFTKVDDLSKFHGDGWKLISEDSLIQENNPFNELLNDYDKE